MKRKLNTIDQKSSTKTAGKKMKVTLNQKIEQIFKQVGEFGPYQLFVFILGGLISIVPAIVGYSFAFYAAVPQFR